MRALTAATAAAKGSAPTLARAVVRLLAWPVIWGFAWTIVPAQAAAGDPPPEPPIAYAAACGTPGDPPQVTITDTVKGPVVTYWRGTVRQQSRDANLAHKSRRFFFKVKDGDTLIEFQGHAYHDRLEGLLSDPEGARTINVPAVDTAIAGTAARETSASPCRPTHPEKDHP